MKKNFSIIGLAGFVSKRHVHAIKETGNDLISGMDYHDNVGFLDSYFPNCNFFTNYEKFESYISKYSKKIDYLSICTPNYLHDTHARLGIDNGIDVICEKPLVINVKNLKYLKKIEKKNNRKIYCILQLRLHKETKKLIINKKKIRNIDITYISPRGKWYYESWKGDEKKSGGIETNIGIHLFDLLFYIFGEYSNIKLFLRKKNVSSGILYFGFTKVRWYLSIDKKDLKYFPHNKKNIREFKVGNKKIDFSKSFNNLHTESYKHILKGNGFGIDDVNNSIKLVNYIKKIKISKILNQKEIHPLLKRIKNDKIN
jgi:UDP-N-acetyl-2-amino-2-deoxyglucuronate dehydrogenase